MNSRRVAKAAEAIRETVSTVILFELRDPRIPKGGVTVTRVEVTGDLRAAKVYVSIMGPPKVQSLAMHGIDSARGFIQTKVGDRLQIRYCPILTFYLDQGLKRSAEAARLIREVLADSPSSDALSPDEIGDETNADESSPDEHAEDFTDVLLGSHDLPMAEEDPFSAEAIARRKKRLRNPDDEDAARYEALAGEWSEDETDDDGEDDPDANRAPPNVPPAPDGPAP